MVVSADPGIIFTLLHYVALVYGGWMMRRFVRQWRWLLPPAGKRTMKRMERCCPMVVRRAELRPVAIRNLFYVGRPQGGASAVPA